MPTGAPGVLITLTDGAGNYDALYLPQASAAVVAALSTDPTAIPVQILDLAASMIAAGFVLESGGPVTAVVAALLVESEGE